MTLPEAKLLLMTELARYRNLYGEEMLSRQFGGQTLEESVKESTLDLMGKLLVMDEMADKYQIRLNEEDTANILVGQRRIYGHADRNGKGVYRGVGK